MKTQFTRRKVESFKGMDNRLAAESMPIDLLRRAVNVTFDNQGKPKLRTGSAQVFASAHARSIWFDGSRFLFADGTDIKYLVPETGQVLTLAAGVLSDVNVEVAYVTAANQVYWSDGTLTGRINDSRWGLPVGPIPTLSPLTAGGLDAGRYHVAVTRMFGSEESGAQRAVAVDVAQGGGIQVLGLPGTPCRLYLSSANSELMFHYGDTSATTFIMGVSATRGYQLRTLGAYPFPPCTILEYFNGKIYGANKNTMFFTMPMQYRLCRPAQDYVMVPTDITMIKAVVDGIYVSDSTTTYWLPQGADEIHPILPYPAIRGTAVTIKPTHEQVAWFSRRGWVMGSNGGQAKNISTEHIAVNQELTAGAAMYRDFNGVRELISSFRQTAPQDSVAVADYVEAEVIRRQT